MTLRLLHLVIASYALWEAWQGAQVLRRNLLRTLVFGCIGVVHGVVPCIGPAYFERTVDPYEVHLSAGIYALCGTLLLGFGWRLYELIASKRPYIPTFEVMREEWVQRRLNLLFLICMAGGFLAWIGNIYLSGQTLQSMLTSRRMEFRENHAGIVGGIMVHLFCMAYFPGFLAPFLKGRYRIAGIAYAVVFAAALFIFSRGTRAQAIGMLGSLIGGTILAHRISAERLFATTTAMGLVALLAIGLVPLRYRMASMNYGEMVSFLASPEAYQDALRQDPLNYHDHFVGIYNLFPEFVPYVDGASYRRLMFFYLPGARFPQLKPPDPNRDVAKALFGKAAEKTDWMHPPGVFGDIWINFHGWNGLPLMILQGMFLAWLNRRMISNPWFFIALGPQTLYLSLVGIRGQPYTIGLAMLITLSLTYVLMRLLGLPLRPYYQQQAHVAVAPMLPQPAV
ncbi:MAG: oligosaccharide repeat unit polymerase [Planctomycetaceae bacterium]|nr:oligosaccharide repeat unit polymerase [Planctomycetaceae bacterium]